MLQSLALRDFRSYHALSLAVEPGVNVLYGANAQGKTNVLEAVYLCCLGRSHRTAHEAEMVRAGAEHAYASVQVGRQDGPRLVEVLLGRHERKRLQVSGVALRRMSELMGHVQCVLFSPEDLQLLKGGPSLRRRMLDASLCQLRPTYFLALARYKATMKQRNALLKQRDPNLDVLDALDAMMSEAGGEIIRHRRAYVEALGPLAAQLHRDIAGEDALSVHYRTQIDGPDESLSQALLEGYARSRAEDLRRFTTGLGPHQDDLALTLNGQDARAYASQGQQRTIALSLKMAQVAQMAQETGEPPILMLDDVFSELDQRRQQALLAHIQGQALIATATLPDGGLSRAARYLVAQGSITPQRP